METAVKVLSKIKKIVKEDRRFNEEAYLFVLSALDFAMGKMKVRRHLTGPELLNSIREYGISQYGPMTRTVLEFWGINNTEDFGVIVFQMIDEGILRKNEKDSLEDFKNVYDFKEAFKGTFN